MDKKKKKINALDIIIILVVLCLVAFVAIKVLDIGSIGASDNVATVRITFYQGSCPDFVIPHTAIGDTVYDASSEIYLGKVVDIQTGESVEFIEDEELNTITAAVKDDHSSVYITCETTGTLTDNGVVVDSQLYASGHSLVMYAGDGKYYLQVYEVEVVD